MAPACKSFLLSTVVAEPKSNGKVVVTNKLPLDTVLNLDHGDPTVFESYWQKTGDKCTITISGFQSLSYFSNIGNMCWFMEPELGEAIKRLHRVVGNAVVSDDRHVVVGTGSTQLYQAVLYALSSPDQPKPISVVSALPYYSNYPEVTDYLQSGRYKWAGDASTFDKDGPYIELVTSPNNPDGVAREAVVLNKGQGKLVHDFAYYWPQYTPITTTADHDIMLFTASKCTGHAGSRIGWAIVKDKDVAKKMTKFIELNTIGVSRESQLRTAKVLGAVSDSYIGTPDSQNFFKFGQLILAERWQKFREVVERNGIFSLSEYPRQYCLFSAGFTAAHPAFAWLKCNEDIEDGQSFLRGHKIMTRSGSRFGADPKYVRVSMVSKEDEFNLFLERLSSINGILSNGGPV